MPPAEVAPSQGHVTLDSEAGRSGGPEQVGGRSGRARAGIMPGEDAVATGGRAGVSGCSG